MKINVYYLSNNKFVGTYDVDNLQDAKELAAKSEGYLSYDDFVDNCPEFAGYYTIEIFAGAPPT